MNAAFTLILETSTPQASVALAGPLECVKQREFASDRSHHACLFAPLNELLETAASGHLARVLVGGGPGSCRRARASALGGVLRSSTNNNPRVHNLSGETLIPHASEA